MGDLRKKMPVTFWTFLVGALALSGIPPFSGFYSQGFAFSRRRLEQSRIIVLFAVGVCSSPC